MPDPNPTAETNAQNPTSQSTPAVVNAGGGGVSQPPAPQPSALELALQGHGLRAEDVAAYAPILSHFVKNQYTPDVIAGAFGDPVQPQTPRQPAQQHQPAPSLTIADVNAAVQAGIRADRAAQAHENALAVEPSLIDSAVKALDAKANPLAALHLSSTIRALAERTSYPANHALAGQPMPLTKAQVDAAVTKYRSEVARVQGQSMANKANQPFTPASTTDAPVGGRFANQNGQNSKPAKLTPQSVSADVRAMAAQLNGNPMSNFG